jgi:hypothetical protein
VAETSLNRSARRAIIAARIASAMVAMAGILVLIGWVRSIPGLTSLYLPGATLKTNAALCLTCGALANLLFISTTKRYWWFAASVLAAISAAIGALTLSEHLIGWDLGIDQVIATEPAGAIATVSPNRMGPSRICSLGSHCSSVAALLQSAGRSVSSWRSSHRSLRCCRLLDMHTDLASYTTSRDSPGSRWSPPSPCCSWRWLFRQEGRTRASRG